MDNGAAYTGEVTFAPRYGSVATLADEPSGLTCSVTVSREWAATGMASAVVGYPRFELAAEAVRAGRSDALLVPSAYPDIRTFFFDPALRAVDAFLAPLPDIVYAVPGDPGDAGDPGDTGGAGGTVRPARVDMVFHHPATASLVERLPDDIAATTAVTSNSVACREALAFPGTAAAVTNRTSAEHYGMTVVEVLSPSTTMGFVVFARKDAGD